MAALMFLGLSGVYVSLSPGSIAGQGYTGEEIDSGLRMLSVATAWMKGQPLPQIVWSRHGPVPVLFDLPFLKLGKLFVSPDFMLSFSPALFTAGLLTILFLWLRKLCSPGMSLFLVLTAAFGTMLWPYAYIGLETKQSFFVLLAGYLALAGGKIRIWPRLLLFAITCGLALSVKSTGIVLWPAIAYLIYTQFRDDWREQRSKVLACVLIIGLIWTLGHWGTNQFWGPRGGGANSIRPWLIDSPLQFFSNAIGVFGSPTTGLFVYAPVLLLSLYAVPRVLRTNPPIAIFAMLVTGCTVAFLSLLMTASDDVWGARYLHVAIAPLVLCVGCAWHRFGWGRRILLIALVGIGGCISFLGAFYYYGVQEIAAKEVGQNTLEWMTGDEDWNHILFNARLFKVWIDGETSPVLWSAKHVWTWSPPAEAMQWKSLDLTKYCQPQSFMLRYWHVPLSGIARAIFFMYLGSGICGFFLLGWIIWMTVKAGSSPSGEGALVEQRVAMRV
jgi:hypothetical protein